MANKKSPPQSTGARNAAKSVQAELDAPGGHSFRASREMIESIVVAFVLAFLFRTFEAEAFVIPTGSMSPSLLGQHKDVACPQCGHRFTLSASSEETDQVLRLKQQLKSGRVHVRRPEGGVGIRELNREELARLEAQIHSQDIVGGMCPMCRYLMPVRPDLPSNVLDDVDVEKTPHLPSYPGDRILVNKYGYDFHEPQRWDVVVFKFPGNGNMNYIKRLVGLPNESLQIYQGDLFARPLDQPDAPYKILRKPPGKVDAMLHLVHDSDYESATLHRAGWPLRWAATTPEGWELRAEPGPLSVQQSMHADLTSQSSSPDPAWIRYRHILPDTDDWLIVKELEELTDEQRKIWEQSARPPRLINDFNSYNARLQRGWAEQDDWKIATQPFRGSQGTEWVGDLAIECDIDVEASVGELLLDVVEAGYHFRATFQLATGDVTLGVVDGRTEKPLDFQAQGKTPLSRPGSYRVRLANVDDQLLVWVDGQLIDCGDATYDPDTLFQGRETMTPWTSSDERGDQGDLSPAGVGARGAKLTISRLKVYRDIYYIATKYSPTPSSDNDHEYDHLTDYTPVGNRIVLEDGTLVAPLQNQEELFIHPEAWLRFRDRHKRTFEVAANEDAAKDQFFVMGDNSPESQDCRLWLHAASDGQGHYSGRPGGSYLNRRLLIGEAVCVFWPHSWGGVPGIPALPGLPNLRDMRIVR